jgi:NDP-sugar pyrophosphorylase family protein
MTARRTDIDLANWPVAILAGGLATRLRPATERTPKALLTVADEPFLVHQLRLLCSEGFRKIVLCLGYLGDMIESRIGDGKEFGLEIDYSFDGSTLLGTGGALKRAIPKLGARFVVIYGDSYMPVDYAAIVEAFVRSEKPSLMTVFENKSSWDASNILFEAGKIYRYDKKVRTVKMRHIDYGISVLTAGIFDGFRKGTEFDLAHLYSRLISQKQMAAYEVKKRFYEIGSPEGLKELDAVLRKKGVSVPA